MTECNQETFTFAPHFSRRVEAGFTAGQVSTDGGALLLRQADGKIGLLRRVASCFTDRRSPLLVEHRLSEMLSKRIYGLALGYEDLNDHEQLRHDPLIAVLAGRRKLEEPLAGKSTLNRLELAGGSKRYHKIDYTAEKIDALFCDLFIESHSEAPDQIVLDLDATDIPRGLWRLSWLKRWECSGGGNKEVEGAKRASLAGHDDVSRNSVHSAPGCSEAAVSRDCGL